MPFNKIRDDARYAQKIKLVLSDPPYGVLKDKERDFMSNEDKKLYVDCITHCL